MEHKIEKSPILLTGCARSGTSMVAGVFNICGAFGGTMSGPNRYNEKGMFENVFIRDRVEKPYLRSINMDPLGQNPLPDTRNMMIPNNWRSQIEKVMLRERYTEGPWFYKGAKACLIWPIWHHAFPKAKWIIVRRATRDIVNSCEKTAFMHKRTGRDGWLDWVHHHEEKFVEMIQAGLNVKIVWPNRMVNGDYEQMFETLEWAGLKVKPQEIINFIEPKLWHSRKISDIKLENQKK